MLFICACTARQQKQGSRVVKFEYKGYGDTTVALIEGNVYEITHHDDITDTVPVVNVELNVEQSHKGAFTSSEGFFSIGFTKGTFDVVIRKAGYQSLKLTNYEADPDQILFAKIILEKGSGVKTVQLPSRSVTR
ncbi:hypothetical protein GCM10023149_27760 [Mucilaginibacter gynuensis]|uniref:Carboxypeptidase-like regulatory domain-containing protein n=2 Tax=Mucilaginibacter gynuensis TaxID=1302236 RepID=A0ABP8GJG5_9SPHI